MDYTKIKAPYINNKEIKKKADLFRRKFWDDSIPVDIETIIDVKLKIDIIPSLNLKQECDSDALISSDWKSILVDRNEYLDERYQNRLRFSFAHEIGHFVLHKDIYGSFKITALEEFYRFIEKIPKEQYGFFETQANKFAGYLLVKRKLLEKKLDIEIERVKKAIDLNSLNNKTLLKSYIANPLSKEFGISRESMEIILSEFDILNDESGF
ncbi:ImmA/IrrE family metallo-endopeptidase [Patescibacteria group bacterium]|nr:ImmA/IrrE family metallo-endopeptidase [Patescibacteria group bacterium]MBU4580070.1 ImmA/IrrE family metallo-endopeptidase [Patescibacteria group bacterium]